MILDIVAGLVGDGGQARRLQAEYAPLFEYLRNPSRPLAQIGVSDMAESMGMTREHLTRSFSRDFGVGPKGFLNGQLMRRAAARLSTTNPPVKVIAAELGFGNAFHFSRFFKRYTRLSPTAYRASRGV